MIVVVVLALSPVLMGDPQDLEQPFEDQKEDDCADEDEGHDLAVGLGVLEGIRKDMDDCIADDGPAAEGVEHIYQRHEELGGDEGLDADEEDGCHKAHSRNANTHQDAVNPRLLFSDALQAGSSAQQHEENQPKRKGISHLAMNVDYKYQTDYQSKRKYERSSTALVFTIRRRALPLREFSGWKRVFQQPH